MFIYPLNFRVIIGSCIGMFIWVIVIMRPELKSKDEYLTTFGRITYLNERLLDLPYRNLGKYRYLKVDSYKYPFEIYADQQAKRIDELKVGDTVKIYFYESGDIKHEGINRHIQFLDKSDRPYFIRTAFKKQLGLAMFGLVLLVLAIGYIGMKRGKIQY